MAVQVGNRRLCLALFAEPDVANYSNGSRYEDISSTSRVFEECHPPYKCNALVLAPLVPQQLLCEQVSMLREQMTKLLLTHTL